MKLVHHDEIDIGPGPFPQGPVGEDFCCADDDWRGGVYGGVAGDHADVVGTQRIDHLEELLAHERLDRCGIDRSFRLGDHCKRTGQRHEGLATPGWGCQHDVVAGEDRDDRFFLVGIQLEPAPLGPFEEGEQQVIGGRVVGDVAE